MNKYLITYELNNKSKDYIDLYNKIKTYSWWHYIESTWIIKTDKDANTINTSLRPFIDESSDFLLVVKIENSERQGWLPKKAWDWLKS